MMRYCYRTTANNVQVQKVTLIITGDLKHCLPCKQPRFLSTITNEVTVPFIGWVRAKRVTFFANETIWAS